MWYSRLERYSSSSPSSAAPAARRRPAAPRRAGPARAGTGRRPGPGRPAPPPGRGPRPARRTRGGRRIRGPPSPSRSQSARSLFMAADYGPRRIVQFHVLRVPALGRAAAMRPAARWARAMTDSMGLTPLAVGNSGASATNRPSTSWVRWSGPTAGWPGRRPCGRSPSGGRRPGWPGRRRSRPGGSRRPGPVGVGGAGAEGGPLAVDAEHLAGPGGGRDLPGGGHPRRPCGPRRRR